MEESLNKRGITMESLAHDLKQELRAKKTVLQKVKGVVELPKTPTGRDKGSIRIVAVSGEGDPENAETLIAIDMIDWSTRQAARIDAQKLLNAYPAKKVEVSGADGGPIDVAVRSQVAKELLDEVDGATRGVPGKRTEQSPA